MKKDRNCNSNAPYPIYPIPTPPIMPAYQMPMMTPMQPYMQSNQNNSIENQLATLMQQVNNLDRRVTALETTIGSSYNANYNTSNFQMM